MFIIRFVFPYPERPPVNQEHHRFALFKNIVCPARVTPSLKVKHYLFYIPLYP